MIKVSCWIYYFSDKLLYLKFTNLYEQELLVDFEVSEGIFSKARIEETDSVCLWLGANVMLEYSCQEVYHLILYAKVHVFLLFPNIVADSTFQLQANTLLEKNFENAKASLEVLIADLQFLRDQVTITQVT